MPNVRDERESDILALAADMRPADAEEVHASSGFSPEEALRFAVRESRILWCLEDEEGPVSLFGMAEVEPGVGSPWYLANTRHDRHRRYFARHTHDVLRVMHNFYPTLVQRVDARHHDSISWLLWAGFEIVGVVPLGAARRPFILFSKVSNV